jgi:NAD(P)-dependent dehydrogenase (short-subunit alcohol dehydrogenase family)
MTLDFTGRVAVVTGAGGGLGRAHAIALAARGAYVLVNDVGGAVNGSGADRTPAERVAAEITAAGGDAVADSTDVTDPARVEAMVERAVDRWGRIDILINNAGILRDRTFAKLTPDDFRSVLDVHLMGSVHASRAAWPHMAEQNYGRILMTTSVSGIYGNFGQANYAAAKSALVGLTNVLAIEGARKNIRVNALAPTAATRMTNDLLEPELLASITPDTITPGALFLVSDEAPTKTILGAGAGVFAVSKMQEATGVHLDADQLTPEGVAANWDRISDLSQPHDMDSAFAQTRRYVELATARSTDTAG